MERIGSRPQMAWLTVLMLLLCGGALAAGYAYYLAQRKDIQSGIESTVSGIAKLKVQQVQAWRNERVADAQVLAATPFLNLKAAADRERVRGWLEMFRRHAGYAQLALLDREGRVLLEVSQGSIASPARVRPLLAAALASGTIQVSDPYPEKDGGMYLDVAAPRAAGANGAAVLIHLETSGVLGAFLREWPTPSVSAESLLVRLADGRVHFLNRPRHRTGNGGELVLPLRNDLPSAMAVRGIEGVRTGVDYRGVPVVAALRRIPGTPWALVAKVDEEEAYSLLRRQSQATALIVGLLFAACLASYGFFWNRQQSRFYRRLHLADLKRLTLEERYARLRRYINDIVLLMDEPGRILEANDRALETYGYSVEEMLHLSIADLLAPAEACSFGERWSELTALGSQVFEGCHRRKDGTTLPVEVSSRTFEIDGSIYRHSVIRDISERRRTDEQLRRATRAARVLSASNQAVIRSGGEEQLLADICRAVTQAGGYPLCWVGFAEQGEGRPVRPVACSGDHPEYVETLAITWTDLPSGGGPVGTAIREKRTAVFNDAASDPGFAPWREQAARCAYKAVTALPLRCEGTVIGALAIYASEADAFHPEEMGLLEEMAADLSYGLESRRRREQQARAEAALLQSAAEVRALFDIANDAIFIGDLEGQILEVNRVACQKLGYAREELIGMTLPEIGTPLVRAEWQRKQAQLAQSGEALFENIHRRKDGSEFPVEINSRVFHYGGQPAILGVARDISERKRAEAEAAARARELERAKTEAENANRAKSEFLANVSHEIRTPMNAIIGATGLLLDTGLDGEQRDYAETIRGSADALLEIVNDILDLSKIEARKITIEPVVFDLAACLAETGDLLAPEARRKGLDYRFLPQAEVCWVSADIGRVRQIVLNLLSNAIKFTDRGGVTLRLTAAPPCAGRTAIEITVEDTGIGIAADDLPRLFRKFSQIDSSLSKKRDGTGLGLAISRELAELMGGKLTVSSEYGAGSQFRLALPLQLAEAPCEALPAGECGCREAHIAAKRRRILLAEDNPVNQKIALRMLDKMGCMVDIAANGREAVEMSALFPYDLILMDCGMPEMDGLTASKEIRARGGEEHRIPIVALTAHAISGTREQCLDAGMDDYVSKPVSASTMERVLRQWIP